MSGKFPTNDWVLGKVLEEQAERLGNKPFLRFKDGDPVSYLEVNEKVNQLANGLKKLGVKHGDKVILMMPNSLEYIYCWFAVNKLGAVQVPINNANKGYFLEHALNNSEGEVAFVSRQFLERFKASEANLTSLQKIISFVKNEEEHTAEIPAFSNLKVTFFDDVMDNSKQNPGVEVAYSDISSIMYTSGTTGPSKGVLMPHAHTYTFARHLAEQLRLNQEDIFYVCLPLFHANAQLLQVYPVLIAGAEAVIYDKFSASFWLEHIRKCGATVTSTLGVMNDFIYRQPRLPDDHENPLTRMISVPTPAEFGEDFEKRFAVKCIEGYGMTETCLPIYRPFDEPLRPGSCGKVLDEWFEVKIVDPETDIELPPNEVGEIVVRHKQPWTIMQGYYKMPDKTIESWRNLWFHTGDAGMKDEEGYFYFKDRINDYIRVKAENISSFEVEKAIASNPKVEEVAAIAVKSEIAGGEDEVKVCVVLKNKQSLSAEELLDHCQNTMPYFAIPRFIEFKESLPKTPSEKVKKHLLRAEGVNDKTFDRVASGYKIRKD